MIIPVVLLVVMLILMLLLRAVLSPLILIGTVVLSFGAALGLSTLLFKYVFRLSHGGFDTPTRRSRCSCSCSWSRSGIDYNIFLMTRVREETQTRGTREGSLVALAATGGVITSAGLVLAATFAVLGTLPLVFLAEIGTAVALGRPARHDDRALGAGHRAQPRPRRQDLVAEQAGPPYPHPPRGHPADAGHRHRRAGRPGPVAPAATRTGTRARSSAPVRGGGHALAPECRSVRRRGISCRPAHPSGTSAARPARRPARRGRGRGSRGGTAPTSG